MKNNLSALVVGFVFALGLGISGMTDTQKVIGFLDIFGQWDPTLVFVMIGAIASHFVLFRLIRKRNSPLFAVQWSVPQNAKVSSNLILGSFIFGVGWGLAGFCPGPALTSLGSFELRPFIFVISMAVGMWIFKLLDKKFGFKK